MLMGSKAGFWKYVGGPPPPPVMPWLGEAWKERTGVDVVGAVLASANAAGRMDLVAEDAEIVRDSISPRRIVGARALCAVARAMLLDVV